ncbi:hypothetical protein ZHAS_00009040 [Anopheles sinensis]|uniref:Uncharacterized protein n=1 Tax=Anopheles sinensis TaxID=74873 RepID=A0A084VU00_ANOSI|nr:hypothetical protein ZHAS_00009040 [Anopheles sinensis]
MNNHLIKALPAQNDLRSQSGLSYLQALKDTSCRRFRHDSVMVILPCDSIDTLPFSGTVERLEAGTNGSPV